MHALHHLPMEQKQISTAMYGAGERNGLGRFARTVRAASFFNATLRGKSALPRSQRQLAKDRTAQRGLNKWWDDTMDNSRSRVGRKFQSRYGNSQTDNGTEVPRRRDGSNDIAESQSKVLQGVFGRMRSPAKEMANATGLNERACRNQIAGVNCMNLADFFNACQAIPELRDWGARMMGLANTQDPSFGRKVMDGHRAITLRIEADGVKLTAGGGDDA